MSERGMEDTRRGIVRLSLLAIVLMLCCAGALIAYTWAELNLAEAQQETLLVTRKVDRNLMRLRQEATSATAWDAAYRKTAGIMDRDWIDDKLAAYYHLSFEHDVTLLFDGDGVLQYVARDGERAPVANERDLASVLGSTVRRVQAAELHRRARGTAITRQEARRIAERSVVVAADGRAYLVAVAAILPASGRAQGARAATIVVTGWALDEQLLNTIGDDIGVRGLKFTYTRTARAQDGVVPLYDPDGRLLGILTWPLGRPGAEALRDVARPGLAGALVLFAVFILLGLRVRRLLQALRTRDIALERSVAALTQARDDAQAASVAKSEFIANISHEIRTPLNGVLGMAQVLEADELNPVQRERVKVIAQSGKALLAVLNDVLDMSKIEAGRLEIALAPFDLDQIFDDVGETYSAIAAGKGLQLEWRTGEAAGAWEGDVDRMRQILLNLVSNAVKFTARGRILMAASVCEDGLVVSVSDEGIGIPADKLAELFAAFSQLDASRTRRFGGTGLGLAISRRLARLMSGDITVESRAGEGSVFHLRLPLRRAAAPGPVVVAERPQDHVRPLHILAADDNPTNRLVLQALLGPLDADLTLVDDGAQALAAFKARPFDIVLMDVQMPVMDGLAATHAIRALECAEGRARTPILAITANALRHQAEAYLAAGMDGHLAKPLAADALFTAISAALAEPTCAVAGASQPGNLAAA